MLGRQSVLDNMTPGVKYLLFANIGFFLVSWVSPGFLEPYLALRPVEVFTEFKVWQLVTYSFLHEGGMHLFFNMFALLIFGPTLERSWGTKQFLKFFFFCVLGAALAQSLIAPQNLVVGASGGIYGILLAFGLLFPNVTLLLFFILPLRAIQAVFLIAIITLMSAISSGGDSIAHFAHLGGMLTGFLILKFPVLKDKYEEWRDKASASSRKKSSFKFEVFNSSLDDEVNRILDKISSEGVDSLTPDERETMKKYAKRKKS